MINKKFGRSVVVPSGESNAVNNTPAAPVAPMTAVQAPSQQHIPTSNTILVEHENFDFPGSVPAILNDVVIPCEKRITFELTNGGTSPCLTTLSVDRLP